jgi:hypothetical protein
MVRTVSRSPPAPCAGYLSVCPSCISATAPAIANVQRTIEEFLTAVALGNPVFPGSSKRWPISPKPNRKWRRWGIWIIRHLHFEEQHRAVRDVLENLKTDFKTNAESEPEGVRNARNQRRTGAGEIGRMKMTPTFKTPLDRLAKLMSRWVNTARAAQTEGDSRAQPTTLTSFGPIP